MKPILLTLLTLLISASLYGAEFKFGKYTPDVFGKFSESKEITITKNGACYGWQTDSLKPGDKYEIIERFKLPVAPATWGPREDGRPYKVSDDGLVATTVLNVIVGNDGVVKSRWWAVPGDPAGAHEIIIKCNGETKVFKFVIKYEP